MSFFNFSSATLRALVDFSFSVFVFQKEFALVSNVKSLFASIQFYIWLYLSHGKQYILSSPSFSFSLAQSYHELYFSSWFCLIYLELPFLVLNNDHTLDEHLCGLETVSSQWGNCAVHFWVQMVTYNLAITKKKLMLFTSNLLLTLNSLSRSAWSIESTKMILDFPIYGNRWYHLSCNYPESYLNDQCLYWRK